MHTLIKALVLVLTACCSSLAQYTAPAVITSSYPLVQPFNVAPGQLVTLVVHLEFPHGIWSTIRVPAGANLPTSLGGVSGGYSQLGISTGLTGFLEVRPYWGLCPPVAHGSCTNLAAVTIQIPFEAVPGSPTGAGVPYGSIGLALQEKQGPGVDVGTVPNQPHLLTTCDAFLLDSFPAPVVGAGLPCPSVVAHADGSLLSAQNPARPGEVVVAYAVGLGQTDPPLQTGKIVTAPARTLATFGLDFNYHPNALASKPLANAPPPLYSGATPGFVGLYQINFEVPPPPPGTPPCVEPKRADENVVYSNLTVSVGGAYSFDGARLCVAVNP
ncbi:MAG: hypothetical protein IT168_03490 [Bryobacterales bacterium]|nr:hypothetical protein [Bryobacterales bacterium]